MKKLFFALMAVAAITMTVCIGCVGCKKKPINEPDAPENGRDREVLLTDSNGANQATKVPLRLVQDNQ